MATVAVVVRDDLNGWALQTWAANEDVGFSVARVTCDQERTWGNLSFEIKVISEKDADQKNYDVKGLLHLHVSKKVIHKNVPKVPEVPEVPVRRDFEKKKCVWCGSELPSNGAAQFSHLRKHIGQLVKASLLSEEVGRGIRSIVLSDEMVKIFEAGREGRIFLVEGDGAV